MSGPGLTFGLIDGARAASREDELMELRAEVYADGEPEAARRSRVWRRQPGFVLAEARHGGYLVGYACGMPLRPSTSWWKELTTPLRRKAPFRNWGWRRVARTRGPDPGTPALDVLVVALPAGHALD